MGGTWICGMVGKVDLEGENVMGEELFSFVITVFNNQKYIYEALDSVLAQDYPRIQLIVSDDGSLAFETEALRAYIEANKAANITDVQIYAHDKNRGTVRNMEFCRQEAEGAYIMYMAADDALNGNDVLSRYAAEFERGGKDTLVLCSKVAMCGEELSKVEHYEPSEEGIRAIRDLPPEQLFSRMTHTWTIPTTSCCYRREVYDAVGGYDMDYFITEDGPLFMKLARIGIRIHWVDGLVAALHRGGGISHGNTLNLSENYRKYRYDEIVFFEKEILPFKSLILAKDIKPMEQKWDYVQRAYFETFILPTLQGKDLLRYQLKHFPQYMRGVLRRTKEKAVGWIEDNGLNRNLLAICAICMIVCFLIRFQIMGLPVATDSDMVAFCKMVAIISGGFALFLRIMRVVRQLWLTVKYVFSGR